MRNDRSIPLSAQQRVDWGMFFLDDENMSHRIDTRITEAMKHAPTEDRNVQVNIVSSNLKAGYKKKMPTGVAIREYLMQQFPNFTFEDIDMTLPLIASLKDQITEENLPIWLYTLAEAESIKGRDGGIDLKGNSLGTVGSIIVADTLCAAIAFSDIDKFCSSECARTFADQWIAGFKLLDFFDTTEE